MEKIEYKTKYLQDIAKSGNIGNNGWDFLIIAADGFWVDGGTTLNVFETENPFEKIVSLSKFTKAVKQIKADDTEISLDKNESRVLLKSKKQKFSLPIVKDMSLTKRLSIHRENLKKVFGFVELPEQWKAYFKESLELQKSNMGGVFSSGGSFYSTDGIHLKIRYVGENLPSFWISQDSVKLVTSIEGAASIADSNTMLWIKGKNHWTGVLKMSMSNYPLEAIKTIRDKMDTAPSIAEIEINKEIISAVKAAESMSADDTGYAKLNVCLEDGTAHIASNAAGGGYEGEAALTKAVDKKYELVCAASSLLLTAGKQIQFKDIDRAVMVYKDDSAVFIASIESFEEVV